MVVVVLFQYAAENLLGNIYIFPMKTLIYFLTLWISVVLAGIRKVKTPNAVLSYDSLPGPTIPASCNPAKGIFANKPGVFVLLVHLHAKDIISADLVHEKLLEAHDVYTQDIGTLAWDILKDSESPLDFAIIEKYSTRSVRLSFVLHLLLVIDFV